MKNKGFSLIELLATIIIVSILVTTAYIGYSSYINKTKKEAFKQNVDSVKIAVDFYIQNNRKTLFKENGHEEKIMLHKLRELGYLEQDIYDEDNNSCMEESFITIKRENNKYTYNIEMICGNSELEFIINQNNDE